MSSAKLALLAFVAASSVYAAGNGKSLKVEFGRNGVTVGDLKPGTHVAWIAMLREQRQHHTRVRILRGYGPVTPNSTFAIEREFADTTRGIWAIAEVKEGASVQAASPGTTVSTRPMMVRAVDGAEVVELDSFAVEVLYVRPGRGAWTYNVADGGGHDADGAQNGTIVMPLALLKALKGNPHPPTNVAVGDLVLVIDPRGMRTANVEVRR